MNKSARMCGCASKLFDSSSTASYPRFMTTAVSGPSCLTIIGVFSVCVVGGAFLIVELVTACSGTHCCILATLAEIALTNNAFAGRSGCSSSLFLVGNNDENAEVVLSQGKSPQDLRIPYIYGAQNILERDDMRYNIGDGAFRQIQRF